MKTDISGIGDVHMAAFNDMKFETYPDLWKQTDKWVDYEMKVVRGKNGFSADFRAKNLKTVNMRICILARGKQK